MSGTVANPIGITDPPIDELLEHVDSKYALVIFASKRARQINAYFSQLHGGLLENVGPLVESRVQEKPLSIAMREINAGLLKMEEIDPNAQPSAQDLADLEASFGPVDPGFGDTPSFSN
ncbi:DNA-directed RNA polymerase subunit omega [Rarobacter incanus]|uniref:DNA-directed RNA polymerase subunit omega n=1 Tax=Rarobacter incanus TaxID=153494 RepID=A0A542SN05_9MICO|nr:DNA-directed RNA polymerase subunit omega [Rarobacter incanus]TQK75627.1 DNA-directed RNA polymerase subunit omega [Rarobacter incanus]